MTRQPPSKTGAATHAAALHADDTTTRAPKVDEVLRSLEGTTVYYDSLSGNNGDDLIREGCELAIREAGLTSVATPEEAQTVIITGGGGMIESSKAGIGGLRAHLDRRPEQGIVVLPQSYWFKTLDFASLFRGRTAPVTLFARERYSLEILQQLDLPSSVTLGLDHDMALRLRRSDFIKRLKSQSRTKHVLIVERGDGEATTGIKHRAIGNRSINRFVPQALKAPLKRAIRKRQAQQHAATSSYVSRMLELVEREHGGVADLPLITSDISDPGNATYEGFCNAINDAAVVVTNRLHVGVLAAMLNKPTYLATNSYHKIRGIYEYSLRDMSHVTFVQDSPG